MEQPEQGIIRSVIDSGTVVQVFLDTEGGTRVLAADGNMWRRAQASIGRTSLSGLRIEFEASDWGGLEWFSIIEDGFVVCPNCRKHIPQDLNADYCVFGRHPVKKLRPSNGAHADE